MKKIKYEEPIGKLSEMIDLYRAKIKEALEERDIAVIYFGSNAPAANPNDEDSFLCFEMLKYENGEIQLAEVEEDDYSEDPTILTKEQVESDKLDDCHFAEAFADAAWEYWEDVAQEGAHSWDSLYYCLCQAINECADEE